MTTKIKRSKIYISEEKEIKPSPKTKESVAFQCNTKSGKFHFILKLMTNSNYEQAMIDECKGKKKKT